MICNNNRNGLKFRRLVRLILNQLCHAAVKKHVILCCQEGHCSAVSATGKDLPGVLYLGGPSYFKKDKVEENLEKARKKEFYEHNP